MIRRLLRPPAILTYHGVARPNGDPNRLVTSPEHLESQITAADVTLSDDVLDRIDEIVPPGLDINPADGGWPHNPWLQPGARRRP